MVLMEGITHFEKLNKILISEIKNIQCFNLATDISSLNKTIDKFNFEKIYDQVLDFHEFVSDNFDFDKIYKENGKYNILLNERFKTKESMCIKWEKNLKRKIPLNKVCNDTFALRVVVPFNRNTITEIVEKQFSNSSVKIINYYWKTKSIDDGYRGIHVYLKNNPRCFPVEIQYWNREDAILNFYTHEVIYKRVVNGEISSFIEEVNEYSLALRRWIEQIPEKPNKLDKSFIDFWYEQFTE